MLQYTPGTHRDVHQHQPASELVPGLVSSVESFQKVTRSITRTVELRSVSAILFPLFERSNHQHCLLLRHPKHVTSHDEAGKYERLIGCTVDVPTMIKKRPSLKLNRGDIFVQRGLPLQGSTGGSSATTGSAVYRHSQPCAGLANLGNTCYANSVLQVLRSCAGFCNGVANLAALRDYPFGSPHSRVAASGYQSQSTRSGVSQLCARETQPSCRTPSLVSCLSQVWPVALLV